jgi:hypothetical protein
VNDMYRLNTFPFAERQRVLANIMAREPHYRKAVEGYAACFALIVNFRTRDLRLIDLRPEEAWFTSVWYGKDRFREDGLSSATVAMAIWESFMGKEACSVYFWTIWERRMRDRRGAG